MENDPIRQMRRFLTGYGAWEDLSPALQSWSRFFFYQGAVEIIRMETTQERREALEKLPANVRSHVEMEVRRIWPYRGELG